MSARRAELTSAQAEAEAAQTALERAREDIEGLRQQHAAALEQSNQLAQSVIALQPLQPQNEDLKRQLAESQAGLSEAKEQLKEMMELRTALETATEARRRVERRMDTLATALDESEAVRAQAVGLHTAQCQEKAVLLAELQGMRAELGSRDGLQGTTLALQSEVLSLRTQHAKLLAGLHTGVEGDDIVVGAFGQATREPWE